MSGNLGNGSRAAVEAKGGDESVVTSVFGASSVPAGKSSSRCAGAHDSGQGTPRVSFRASPVSETHEIEASACPAEHFLGVHRSERGQREEEVGS